LSSIELHAEMVGYRSAELLQHMMSGGECPDRPILVPPRGVIARASSDITAIEDAEVAGACMFIRERFSSSIDVADVVRASLLSRRTLERRFEKAMGRTLAREIGRVRIEHAKRLLSDTEMSMPQVAERIGLANAERLSVTFRRATGMTPSAYRRQSRF
ncbi:MAG TPA: helix-turn-helix domain-containing protein, partial [Phycisphaerae bacterium]|nr:helix-turn-helix domain-containing protein [Phycisphaerae bacterium]